MKKLFFSLLLIFAITLAWTTPALASGPLEGKIVVGEDYVLKSGETISGDLVVISGSATVEKGAVVEGNVVVMGGSADLAGRVKQTVTVMGGSATLRSSAVVDEQLVVLGGDITREEGAEVKGGEGQGFGNDSRWQPFRGSPFAAVANFYRQVFETLVTIIAISLLALLVALLLPEHTARVSAAIVTAPAVSGLLGLLTLVAVPILLGLIAITLCLIPISVLGFMLFIAAILFGWISFGLLIGTRLMAAFRWNVPPVGAAALGTLILTAIACVPCLGGVLALVAASLGLGAVVLTRFGTKPYFIIQAPAAPAAPSTNEPPAETATFVNAEPAVPAPETTTVVETPEEPTPGPDEPTI